MPDLLDQTDADVARFLADGAYDGDPTSDLLFERFLNPERVSMPDIDIDFADREREKAINFVRQRYGNDSVTQIITFGTMAARAAVRDVGRVLGMSYDEVDTIAKMIPEELKMTLDKALKMRPELAELVEKDSRYRKLMRISKVLEGRFSLVR